METQGFKVNLTGEVKGVILSDGSIKILKKGDKQYENAIKNELKAVHGQDYEAVHDKLYDDLKANGLLNSNFKPLLDYQEARKRYLAKASDAPSKEELDKLFRALISAVAEKTDTKWESLPQTSRSNAQTTAIVAPTATDMLNAIMHKSYLASKDRKAFRNAYHCAQTGLAGDDKAFVEMELKRIYDMLETGDSGKIAEDFCATFGGASKETGQPASSATDEELSQLEDELDAVSKLENNPQFGTARKELFGAIKSITERIDALSKTNPEEEKKLIKNLGQEMRDSLKILKDLDEYDDARVNAEYKKFRDKVKAEKSLLNLEFLKKTQDSKIEATIESNNTKIDREGNKQTKLALNTAETQGKIDGRNTEIVFDEDNMPEPKTPATNMGELNGQLYNQEQAIKTLASISSNKLKVVRNNGKMDYERGRNLYAPNVGRTRGAIDYFKNLNRLGKEIGKDTFASGVAADFLISVVSK